MQPCKVPTSSCRLITRDGICRIKSEWLGSVLGFILVAYKTGHVKQSGNACVAGQNNAIIHKDCFPWPLSVSAAKDIYVVTQREQKGNKIRYTFKEIITFRKNIPYDYLIPFESQPLEYPTIRF